MIKTPNTYHSTPLHRKNMAYLGPTITGAIYATYTLMSIV